MACQPIPFQDGWTRLREKGFDKILQRLEQSDLEKRDGDLRIEQQGWVTENAQPSKVVKGRKRAQLLDKKELVELYSLTYKMCTQAPPHNWSGKLYYSILGELEEIAKEVIEPKIRRASEDAVLEVLLVEWEKYSRLIKSVQGIAGYLDRFYVKRLALDSLHDMSIRTFYQHVFCKNQDAITQAFLDLVERDRRTLAAAPRQQAERQREHQILDQVKDIYIQVGHNSLEVYEDVLQKPLLEQTHLFMRQLAQEWLPASNCTQYLYKVKAQLAAENARVDQYLHSETRELLVKCCERELIGEHLATILQMPGSGCRWLLREEKNDVLHLMFVLLRRVPNGLAPMSAIFKEHLQDVGSSLLATPDFANQWSNKLDDTLIARFMALHQRYRALVHSAFSEHNMFHRAFKEAWEMFVNLPLPAFEEKVAAGDVRQREVTISELLSDFVDRRMRKAASEMVPASPAPGQGLKQAQWDNSLTPRTETSLERQLAAALEIFSYIGDKDVFAHFYKKHLAKRLILNRTQSIQLEQFLVSKLKLVCGNPYVSKFSGMIRDLLLAQDLQRDFLAFAKRERENDLLLGKGDDDGDDNEEDDDKSAVTTATETLASHPVIHPFDFDVSVKVLTSGFWPSYKNEPIECLPGQLAHVTKVFGRFYDSRTAQRTVTWIHALSSAVLTCCFADGKRVDISLTTFQATIMLLFNKSAAVDVLQADQQRLSAQDIATATGCSVEIIEKQLRSLVKGKYKIMVEHPGDPATYSVNWNFTSRARRIRVPTLPAEKAAMSQEERQANMLKISEERRHSVEAAIVRIMKTHKTLSYQELCAKVVAQLAKLFQAHPKTIRQRVDDLVQRDYLEGDDAALSYVA